MAIPPYAQPYITLPNGFSADELDRIARIGDRLTAGKATVGGSYNADKYQDLRITEAAWIYPTEETHWLYARMGELVSSVNESFFQFELTKFAEPFQYTIYRASEASHFDWHVDHGEDTDKPRKLSLSIQLSDPAQYEGCDLQMLLGKNFCAAPRDRGAVIAFPSYVLHRVTPIIAGERKALVAWVTGPKFK
jgi:PKHD-type hydroxylase